MDSITTIASAITAGAAANKERTASAAVKDSYREFKLFIASRFYKHPGVLEAMGSVEKRPDSRARQEVLQEELAEAKESYDAPVVQRAQEFMAFLEQQGAPG